MKIDKYAVLFNYFRQCPYLENLMSIAGESDWGNNVILPQGASPATQYQEKVDTLGNYYCEPVPYPSVYEDFQINCFVKTDPRDDSVPLDNYNVLKYNEVVGVCDWVKEQNYSRNFPGINEQIVSIECNPFVPQIRYVDPDTNTVGYFITVRLRYVNKDIYRPKLVIEYEFTD